MVLLETAFSLFHIVTSYLHLGKNIPSSLLEIDPKRIHLLSQLF